MASIQIPVLLEKVQVDALCSWCVFARSICDRLSKRIESPLPLPSVSTWTSPTRNLKSAWMKTSTKPSGQSSKPRKAGTSPQPPADELNGWGGDIEFYTDDNKTNVWETSAWRRSASQTVGASIQRQTITYPARWLLHAENNSASIYFQAIVAAEVPYGPWLDGNGESFEDQWIADQTGQAAGSPALSSFRQSTNFHAYSKSPTAEFRMNVYLPLSRFPMVFPRRRPGRGSAGRAPQKPKGRVVSPKRPKSAAKPPLTTNAANPRESKPRPIGFCLLLHSCLRAFA